MAPEVLRGEAADERSDIWALGVVLQELVTGHRPFLGNTEFELTAAILHESPASMPHEVPTSVANIVSRCLRKDPRERYQHAADVTHDLDEAQWTLGDVSPNSVETPSIAVLPFVDTSRDKDNDYFADGLSEEMLNVLTRIRGLGVASRTSAFYFKGKDVDLATVAMKLNVAATRGQRTHGGQTCANHRRPDPCGDRFVPVVADLRPRAGRHLRRAGRHRTVRGEGAARDMRGTRPNGRCSRSRSFLRPTSRWGWFGWTMTGTGRVQRHRFSAR